MRTATKPRFIFEITEEQYKRAAKCLSQYGIRVAIFRTILDDVLDLVENYGGVAIGAMIGDNARPKDVVPSLKRAQRLGEIDVEP